MVDLLSALGGVDVALERPQPFLVRPGLAILGPLGTPQQLVDDAAKGTKQA